MTTRQRKVLVYSGRVNVQALDAPLALRECPQLTSTSFFRDRTKLMRTIETQRGFYMLLRNVITVMGFAKEFSIRLRTKIRLVPPSRNWCGKYAEPLWQAVPL